LELRVTSAQRKEAKLAVDMFAAAEILGPNERRSYVYELIVRRNSKKLGVFGNSAPGCGRSGLTV
jgi:hypothetical protein